LFKKKKKDNSVKASANGGESGIRAHDTFNSIHAFQACTSQQLSPYITTVLI